MEEESLNDAFWAVSRRLREQARSEMEPWGVAPSQFRALSVLLAHGDMRLSALAERLRIAPRSATEVVDDLQERGLAERRPDPDDRRATLVTLTDLGRTTGAEIKAARSAAGQRVFAALTPDDQAQLARILRQLT
ncbi:MarR family transcriptional regulator [Actinoplanes sp. SE50]|uniref:MarR family winged helix-turn-helix transcriptional regulator n=1 Tax=unclassified Actinoplanes TaxID=2626549 RepID=UPI00023EBD08|nr:MULTISPECIES: MarR family transcriptional regulator [unclassified Actinoplanes]AEV83449.1 HTH-type transcriptional regulator mhqR [Actinoplanes sp. SE50/110]ATO81842.1 MarR family transcriptional regulator [Actinoplanes sp. SE50]SLL99250.1 MarR family transcriptional regulator [Actinoplanes sp. SE50/110]